MPIEIWLDPQANYLACRRVIIEKQPGAGSGGERTEHRVKKFAEVSPGVFFPELIEMRVLAGSGEKPRSVRITRVTDVRVNVPLPADTFDFHFPPGILVSDLIRGKEYPVDPDGNPAGPMTDIDVVPRVAPRISGPTAPTVEEPKSWTAWILPLSACVLAVGVALGYVRKRAAFRANG